MPRGFCILCRFRAAPHLVTAPQRVDRRQHQQRPGVLQSKYRKKRHISVIFRSPGRAHGSIRVPGESLIVVKNRFRRPLPGAHREEVRGRNPAAADAEPRRGLAGIPTPSDRSGSVRAATILRQPLHAAHSLSSAETRGEAWPPIPFDGTRTDRSTRESPVQTPQPVCPVRCGRGPGPGAPGPRGSAAVETGAGEPEPPVSPAGPSVRAGDGGRLRSPSTSTSPRARRTSSPPGRCGASARRRPASGGCARSPIRCDRGSSARG